MSDEWPKVGRLAGVDFGTVRVGNAVCDPQQTMSGPLTVYARRNRAADAGWFLDLARREEIVAWVLGLPVHLDGRESQKSQQARQFGAWLQETTGKPVRYFDERFSTAEAEEGLLAEDITSIRRKERRDMLAAQMMLQAFLESSHADGSQPLGLDD